MKYLPLLLVLAFIGCNTESQTTENPPDIFVSHSTGRIITDGGATRGVGWGDVDNDGIPELFTANTSGQWNAFYKNLGSGKLKKITENRDHTFATSVSYGGRSEGVSWVDYDNDGDLDLYICSRGYEPNQLFRNDSSSGFSLMENHPLARDSVSSSMACWADYDLDGDLDVLLIGYRYNGNKLYNNTGDGNFEPITDHVLVEGNGRGRTCACADMNYDGLAEIFVGNARTENFFYLNKGSWEFEKITSGPIVEDMGYAYGSSWADFDDNGYLDLFIANFDKENLLFANDGQGNLVQVTDGELVTEKGGASKGHSWGDYDNDGDLDLYVGNGTYGNDMRNFLYLNTGSGGFERYLSGVVEQHADTSAGVAHADFDRDGDLDVFVANWGAADQINRFYINQTSGKNWVTFRLKGTKSNTQGIGSHVAMFITENGNSKQMHRWLYPITGYGSQNDNELHFGLNEIRRIDSIHVYWPSGEQTTLSDVGINTHWMVSEDGSIETIN